MYHSIVNIPFYKLNVDETVIGQGGFGEIHKAILDQKYPVAIKKLKDQRPYKDLVKEFEIQVKKLCSLEHPTILKYFGVCTERPNISIVMELREEGSMYDMLHVKGQLLNSEQEDSMVSDCLKALNYIHENEIAHRDIKSTNILIYQNYHCKLGDFGLSLKDYSRVSSSVTHPSVFATLPYQPPEILCGDFLELDALKKADVYSMAIVLVELLTKKLPFEGIDKYDVRKHVCSGGRPETKSIRPLKLKNLLNKAMSEDPNDRPTASEFLNQWQNSKGTIPGRPSSSYLRKRIHSDCK